MTDFEIWDSRSGNMLLSAQDSGAAWAWLRDFRARHGDEALDGLSVGTGAGEQVASGSELRDILDECEASDAEFGALVGALDIADPAPEAGLMASEDRRSE